MKTGGGDVTLTGVAATGEALKNLTTGRWIMLNQGALGRWYRVIALSEYDEAAYQRQVTLAGRDWDATNFSAPKATVLPSAVTRRVAVEAAVSDGWYKYVGLNGRVVGINRFGASAPAKTIFDKFGFTVENIVAKAKEL